MTEQATSIPQSGPTHYRPSGRVSWLRFLPLLAVTSFVALVMAFVLLLCETNLYFFIFTPIIVSLPVLGLFHVVLHVGQCRNSAIGLLAGLLLFTTYYIGYWGLSFVGNVLVHGPEAVQEMERITGARGLWGYVKYRCSITVIKETPGLPETDSEPDSADTVGAYLFYTMEVVLLLLIFGSMGNKLSRRVFSERCRKWAKSYEVRFPPGAFEDVIAGVKGADWARLKGLPMMPKLGGNQTSASFVTLKIEYFKDEPGFPVFATVGGMNLGKIPAAKAAGAKGFGGISKTFIKQQLVPRELVPAVVSAVKTLPITLPEGVSPATFPAPSMPSSQNMAGNALSTEVQEEPETRNVVYSSGFRGVLERIGLRQPTIEGPDFRERAVAASQALLAAEGSMVRAGDASVSLCLPVDLAHRVDPGTVCGIHKGSLLGGIMSIAIGAVSAFTGIGLSPETGNPPPLPATLMILGMSLFLLGLLTMLLSISIKGRRAPRRLLNRPGSLFDKHARPQEVLRFEDAETYHVHKSIPEDIVVCYLDKTGRRILAEGCAHRYVIRGADVVTLEPLESGQVVSLRLTYRVGDEELAVIAYRQSTGGLMLNPLLTGGTAKRLAKKLRRTLGLDA